MTAILKKELRTYFNSLSGYVFLGIFVALTGINFGDINIKYLSPYYSLTLSQSAIIFLVLIPAITMRLFSDEAKQKTDQLLYTSPLKIHQIVMGKYLAALILLMTGLAITVIFPIIMSMYGSIPIIETVGTFVAYILLAACYISIGVFISSLTDSPVIAAIATFSALWVLILLERYKLSMPTDRISSAVFIGALILLIAFVLYDGTKNLIASSIFTTICGAAAIIAFYVNPLLYDGVIIKFLNWFSLESRFDGFTLGIFNIANIVYYITFISAFIYLTINTIEKRRWK